MIDSKKNILLAVLVLGVVAMTVAFAAFSTNLRISGTASIPDTRWNIHFDNWSLNTASTVTEGGVTHQNTAEYPTVEQLQKSLSPNITLVEGLNVTLNQPGDYVKYNFQIINDGTIDAMVENFQKDLTCGSGQDCSHIDYNIDCRDSVLGGNDMLEAGSVLGVNERAYCSLEVKYKDQTNQNSGNAGSTQTYTQPAVNVTLTANWQHSQIKDIYEYSTGGTPSSQMPDSGVFFKINKSTGGKQVCNTFHGGVACSSSIRYEGENDAKTIAFKQQMEAVGAVCTANNEYGYYWCEDSQINNVNCAIYTNSEIRCNAYSNACYIQPSTNKENCY